MNRQARRARGEIRAVTDDNGVHYVTLQPITPGVVDDYGSVWMPDTFDLSLDARPPTLAWGHSWTEPIGRACGWERQGDLRAIRFRLDPIDQAERAFVQMQPGPNGEPATIDDCSVGFSNVDRREPTDDDLKRWPGCREVITRADLDEVSLVLRGAVPGAKVLAVRSAGGARTMVDESTLIDLAKKVAAGELTEDEAKAALALVAHDDDGDEDGGGGDDDDTTVTDAEAAEAEADALLTEMGVI